MTVRVIDLSTGIETSREYTQEELASFAYDPRSMILNQINDLERQQLMPRATREFMLLFMESQATPEILAVNYGYQAVKAFDEQIKELRAQL